MKRKILLLFTLILLSCGCTATYNLNIENDSFNESINILIPDVESDEYASYLSNDQYVKSTISSGVLYDKKIEDLIDEKKLTLKHSYSFNEYKNNLSNKCFEKIRFDEKDGYYSLVATNFNCFGGFDISADNYKINISTNYNVTKNNADKVKNGKYTWYFNKNNYKKKSIVFQYQKIKENKSYADYLVPIFVSVIISVLIIVLVRLFYVYRERRKV